MCNILSYCVNFYYMYNWHVFHFIEYGIFLLIIKHSTLEINNKLLEFFLWHLLLLTTGTIILRAFAGYVTEVTILRQKEKN